MQANINICVTLVSKDTQHWWCKFGLGIIFVHCFNFQNWWVKINLVVQINSSGTLSGMCKIHIFSYISTIKETYIIIQYRRVGRGNYIIWGSTVKRISHFLFCYSKKKEGSIMSLMLFKNVCSLNLRYFGSY